ncbi:hypothetical protein ACHAXN_012290 [Cyclotella atomus]|jgi:hypothetical protein
MKYIISLSFLLLGTNAVHDNDEAFRVLRGRVGGQGMGQGGRGGMMGGHGEGGRNHTMGNRTEMLIQVCADNNIVCEEVDQDFLANNCTKPERPDWSRDLLVIVEEVNDELDGERDRSLRGPHGGHGGQGGGRFGNLTDAERDEMMLKHLTCKCCGDHDDEDGSD